MPDLCNFPSSVSDARCVLPAGHPADSMTRFHRFTTDPYVTTQAYPALDFVDAEGQRYTLSPANDCPHPDLSAVPLKPVSPGIPDAVGMRCTVCGTIAEMRER